MLEEMGLTDDAFDIVKYTESLRSDTDKVFNINKSIAAFFEENSTDHEDLIDLTKIKESMLDI